MGEGGRSPWAEVSICLPCGQQCFCSQTHRLRLGLTSLPLLALKTADWTRKTLRILQGPLVYTHINLSHPKSPVSVLFCLYLSSSMEILADKYNTFILLSTFRWDNWVYSSLFPNLSMATDILEDVNTVHTNHQIHSDPFAYIFVVSLYISMHTCIT